MSTAWVNSNERQHLVADLCAYSSTVASHICFLHSSRVGSAAQVEAILSTSPSMLEGKMMPLKRLSILLIVRRCEAATCRLADRTD